MGLSDPPLEFLVSEKRTEREIDSLILFHRPPRSHLKTAMYWYFRKQFYLLSISVLIVA